MLRLSPHGETAVPMRPIREERKELSRGRACAFAACLTAPRRWQYCWAMGKCDLPMRRHARESRPAHRKDAACPQQRSSPSTISRAAAFTLAFGLAAAVSIFEVL